MRASRWVLAEKIGHPLAAVHERVPLYADRLSNPVDRFMRHLKAGKLAQRLNWSVVDDPALFQIGGKHRTTRNPAVTPENAGDSLFLRVERQTLARLPESGFVLFAIHVHSAPVARIAADPAVAGRLAEAVAASAGGHGRLQEPAEHPRRAARLSGAARGGVIFACFGRNEPRSR